MHLGGVIAQAKGRTRENLDPSHHGRKEEWIGPILHFKEGHEEAEQTQNDGAPHNYSNLLLSRVRHAWHLHSERNGAERKERIQNAHQLTFGAKLSAEAICNIRNLPALCLGKVWCFADMVEHVTGREQQDRNERYGSPGGGMSDDGYQIPSGEDEGKNTSQYCCGRDS